MPAKRLSGAATMELRRAESRARYGRLRGNLMANLRKMRDDIDYFGNCADDVAGTGDECDMLACFASNTLHAVEALIDKIEGVVTRKKATRAR